MKDDERAEVIMALDNPQEMKAAGSTMDDIDEDLWNDKSQEVVEAGNMAKVMLSKTMRLTSFKEYDVFFVTSCVYEDCDCCKKIYIYQHP